MNKKKSLEKNERKTLKCLKRGHWIDDELNFSFFFYLADAIYKIKTVIPLVIAIVAENSVCVCMCWCVSVRQRGSSWVHVRFRRNISPFILSFFSWRFVYLCMWLCEEKGKKTKIYIHFSLHNRGDCTYRTGVNVLDKWNACVPVKNFFFFVYKREISSYRFV